MTDARELTRREALRLSVAAFTSCLARDIKAAQYSERHGLSAFGDLISIGFQTF
jgi:hypothetical protein